MTIDAPCKPVIPHSPNAPGRAYALLMHGERAPAEYTELANARRLSVRSVMRPEPNIDLLAKVFMKMALDDDVDNRRRREQPLSQAAIHATYPPRPDAA